MTNYERIKNMSVEEMAEYFSKRKKDCLGCEIFDFCRSDSERICTESFFDWLNEEAEQ